MGKITGIYKISIPSIPIKAVETLKQRPITIRKDNKRIRIYPPGFDCKRVWKLIQGENPPTEISLSQGETQYADSLYILIVKDAYLPKGSDLKPEYENIDTEVENITVKIMKLLRKQLPKTLINMSNPLQYNSIYKLYSESHENISLGGASKGIKVNYHSPQYYLDLEKWGALEKAIRTNEDTEIWQDFLYDANASLKEGELSKAIIFASIGYEIFIKEYTEKAVKGTSLSVVFWKYLKRHQPRVLDYYDSILHLITGHSLRVESPDLYLSLEHLNSARNDIVHEGKLLLSISQNKQLSKDINNINQVIAWVNAL